MGTGPVPKGAACAWLGLDVFLCNRRIAQGKCGKLELGAPWCLQTAHSQNTIQLVVRSEREHVHLVQLSLPRSTT